MRNALIGALLFSLAAVPAFAQDAAPIAPVNGPQFATITDSSALSSNLVGLDVVTAGAQTIGQIKDIVFGPDNGVEGFVVSVGGFLGMGEHYVAVDPASIVITHDASDNKWHAVMNATADQLKAAPAFTYDGK